MIIQKMMISRDGGSMGYLIRSTICQFHIPVANHVSALSALRELMDQDGGKSGRSFVGAQVFQTHFAFCNLAVPSQWKTLAQAMEELRWETVEDETGIINIRFRGEKQGDDHTILCALAPFIQDGSFITMLGEDGYEWRWDFVNGDLLSWA